MDWLRMGGDAPEADAIGRLAAYRAWADGAGTRLPPGDDDLSQLVSLKRAEARRKGSVLLFS